MQVIKHGQYGEMALEMIFKILILLVTVAVIVGLIIRFSDDTRNVVKGFICKVFGCKTSVQEFPKTVEKDAFTSGEIATYIESCYNTITALPETEQPPSVNCFLLIGRTFESAGITDRVSPSIRNNVVIQADFTRGILVIQFQDPGNKIIVRSTTATS